MKRRLLLAFFAIHCGNTNTAEGQRRMQIKEDNRCEECRITVQSIGRLGAEGTFQVTGYPGVARRSKEGTLYITDPATSLVHRFDKMGRLSGVIGKRGAGPGEYRRVQDVAVLRDGRIVVFDAVLGRLSHFDRTGRFIRSFPFTGGPFAYSAALPNGNIVINGRFFTREAAGFLAQEFTPEGKGIRAFAVDDQNDLSIPARTERLPAAGKRGEVLMIHPFDYVVDVYSAAGKLDRSLYRNARWFPPLPRHLRPTGGTDKLEPSPQIRAAWVDENGLLWVVSITPKKDWRKLFPKPNQYGSVIEVLDYASGSVLSSISIPQRIAHGLDDGGLVAWGEDSDGTPWVEVLEVRLSNPSKRRNVP